MNILIIRLSAIGDVVMASPMANALRARYPEAHIAWLTQPEVVPLLSENPALDAVIPWPRGEWRQAWRRGGPLALTRQVVPFVRRLRRERFDLVLDLQGLLKSGIWAWASGAPRRIGLGSREGSAALMSEVLITSHDDPRIGSEYRALARYLGLPADDFPMDVALDGADRDFARRWAEQAGGGEGYAVVCPFTTRPQKHWRESHWLELIAAIRERFAMPVAILGGPGDRIAAEALAARSKGAEVLAGKTTLRQAAAVIEGATALVGVDTGLTHMGSAFDVPTVALFGSTCPYRDAGRPRTVVLYKHLPCSPCRRRPTCDGDYPCLGAILPGEVLAALEAVVADGVGG